VRTSFYIGSIGFGFLKNNQIYLHSFIENSFPRLGPDGLIVQPEKGKALLWPSILNDEPERLDPRTHHAALPVVKGMKFAANAWIHMRDFKTPHEVGCA
jgi:prolyl 4-hydroxylase